MASRCIRFLFGKVREVGLLLPQRQTYCSAVFSVSMFFFMVSM